MNKKLAFGLLFLLIALASMPARGQTQHVIVVVQENRSPDNLFQDINLYNNGADILLGQGLTGATENAACSTATGGVTWLLPVAELDECFDPQHGHDAGFEAAYDSGNGTFDQACTISPTYPTGCTYTSGPYPNYTYVENYSAGNGYNILDPYFEIAENYGFANYMFQTNQGPSFLAHQFLFSGTSAPGTYGHTLASHNLWESSPWRTPRIQEAQPTTQDASHRQGLKYMISIRANLTPRGTSFRRPRFYLTWGILATITRVWQIYSMRRPFLGRTIPTRAPAT